MTRTDSPSPIVVVGGGLAGLAAAAYVARAGERVTLVERGRRLGGRGASREASGFCFNFGPHALYAGGPGRRVLEELEVEVSGHPPPSSGLFALRRGRRYRLPSGASSLLWTRLLGIGGKLELVRLLGRLPKLETGPLDSLPVAEWLSREVRSPELRELLGGLFRLTSYANHTQRQSAGAGLRQLQLALATGVLYLDGGWQSIVAGLRRAAERAGALLLTGARAVAVETTDQRPSAVRLEDGSLLAARRAVLAVPPAAARSLLAASAGSQTDLFADLTPIEAACLDVGLERLPDPGTLFALGIDQPLYFSVHSSTARLAPEGRALIHVLRYRGPGEELDRQAVASQLEGLLDELQPGWRQLLVERRLQPRMVVSHALVEAGRKRPGIAVPGRRDLYVAGDWVGEEGMLADAALASARRVAVELGVLSRVAAGSTKPERIRAA